MKYFPLIFSFFLLTSLNAQLNHKNITVGSLSREYYEFIPSNYSNSEKAPLVIVLHGIGGFAVDYANYGLNNIADSARFIPVYLQGVQNFFGITSWNNGVAVLSSTADDLGFISDIITSMQTNYNTDPRRVYVVGVSMGAIMTFKAVRHLNDKIAAVVCHIGTMSDEDILNSNPIYPVPTMQVHGTQDTVVPYGDGAFTSLSLVPQTIDKLKTLNGWNGTDSTIFNIPDNVNDNITIERIVYDCTTPFEHWKMNGAGHIFLFESINDTSGFVVTWEFLKQFSHQNPVLSNDKYKAENSPLIYPNPTNGQLNFSALKEESEVYIYSLNQQLILHQSIKNNQLNIDHLADGTYILMIANKGVFTNQQLITKF